MPHRLRSLLRLLAGIAAALLALEAGLRFFATTDPVPPPRILADSLGGDAVVRRQLQEGVSTYRFSTAGARLTGHDPARQNVNAVILGDSYVVAAQVGDESTMGAQLETVARAADVPLDVRQYGWSNAAPAQYVLVAEAVRKRWAPRRVFIVVSEDDMDFHSQTAGSARLRIDRNDGVRIVGGLMDTVPAPPRHGSVLWNLVRYRAHIIELRLRRRATRQRQELVPEVGAPVEAPADSTELAAMPRGVVSVLRDAYGPTLTLVFVASVGVIGEAAPSPVERAFLDACVDLAVDCASTRAPMIERRSAGHVSHGTTTTAIGHGHLTPAGHRVVAELMWDRLR